MKCSLVSLTFLKRSHLSHSIVFLYFFALITEEGFLIPPCYSFSSAQSLSRVQLFATSWSIAHQAPLSVGFSRQEYWSGLPFPSPGDLPNPGIEPRSPALQADALTSEPPGKGLFRWVSYSHQVAKVLEFQLQHQSFQWIFRTDFL